MTMFYDTRSRTFGDARTASPERGAGSVSLPSPAPVFMFVTDTRFGLSDGTAWTATHGLSERRWTRGVEATYAGLVARLHPRRAEETLPVHTTFLVPLPDTVGIGGLMRHAVTIVTRLRRAVELADVVVVRVPSFTALPAALLSKAMGVPLAVEVVGDGGEVALAGAVGRPRRLMSLILRTSSAFVVRRAKAVRYVTQRVLQERYPPGPRARTIGVSSVVIDPSYHSTWSESTKSNSPTIVAVGSQDTRYKGHDVLIKAIPGLAARHPDVRVVLVGGGRDQGRLRALAQDLDVAERVAFSGHLTDRRALHNILTRAWVFVMPSLTEGLPRALIEACSVGVPAVGASVGGVVEILPHHRCFPPNDIVALIERTSALLASASSRRDASRENLMVAQAYMPEHLSEKLHAWNKLLDGLTVGSIQRRS